MILAVECRPCVRCGYGFEVRSHEDGGTILYDDTTGEYRCSECDAIALYGGDFVRLENEQWCSVYGHSYDELTVYNAGCFEDCVGNRYWMTYCRIGEEPYYMKEDAEHTVPDHDYATYMTKTNFTLKSFTYGSQVITDVEMLRKAILSAEEMTMVEMVIECSGHDYSTGKSVNCEAGTHTLTGADLIANGWFASVEEAGNTYQYTR